MDEGRAERFRFSRQESGSGGVERLCGVEVFLGLIDGRVGRGVDDHLRPDLPDPFDGAVGIQQVDLRVIDPDDGAERREAALEFPADLSCVADQ